MSLPEWKIISAYGAQILPHLPDRADVAVAEVDGDGVCLRINPLGASLWGWKRGERLPGEIVGMLGELPPEAPRLLPVKPGGLLLLGLRSGRAAGWILVGYPGEEAASQGESSFGTLVENMPVLVLRMRAGGAVCYANAEARRMTGYTPEEMIGRAFWLEAVPPEERGRLTEAFEEALADGRASVRTPFLTRNGAHRMAEIHLFRAPEDAGAELEGVVFDVTEQMEVEEALFQSESLYRTFLEQSPIGMLHLDAEGMVTFENHPFRQIVGEGVDDAWIGLNIFEIPGLDLGIHGPVRDILEKGKAFHGVEATFERRSEAEARRLVVHGSPIFLPGRVVVGGVLMIEDVTRERRREEELALRDRYGKAEGDLRSAALANPDESRFLRAAARILGEVTGADRLHLLIHDSVDALCVSRAVWVRAAARTDALHLRHDDFPALRTLGASDRRHVHACDGAAAARPLLALTGASEALWSPFYDAGRLGGFVLFERVGEGAEQPWGNAERNLIDHLVGVFETLWAWVQVGNRYRQTVAAIDDGLFHFTFTEDGERHYLFATHQFEALVGHAPEALLERGPSALRWLDDLVHPADHALVRAHDEVLRSGREHRVTYRVRRPDGATRWLREHATPHRDDAGHVTVSGIVADVTEQKTAEEVLLQAKQEAEASNRLKTAFIATMSHEIRTPLGAVSGFAELLAAELEECEAPLPPQIHEFVEAIQDRAQHMLTLVNDLFDLSNVEMGALTVQRAPLNLHALLRPVLDKVAPALERKKLTLSCDFDPANPVVVGDPRRIEQVLSNLMSNAVKFTESGGVSVRTRRQEHEVLVEVSDTGVGMAETYVQRLFTPFSQEDDWRSRRFEGAGLGLALVKRLLDLLGGRIEVESEKGRGTTFRVYLPAAHRTTSRNRPKRARPHA
jgi:PAS domain S-box-containing protein